MIIPRLGYIILVFSIYCCKYNNAIEPLGSNADFRELPCPNPEDIAPCFCTYDIANEVMDLDCSYITGEQELYEVFHADLPIPIFRTLTLGTGHLTQLSDDVFGEATFESVRTDYRINGMLTSVGPKTFMNSVSTLGGITLDNNQITEFPFDTLSEYEKLTALHLRGNPLPSFPVINSETLMGLIIPNGMWHDIPAGALDGLPNLTTLHAYNNRIDSLPKELFSSLPKLNEVLMFGTGLEYLESLQFSVITDKLQVISLSNNFIESVQPDTFRGVPSGIIVLRNNKLTTLSEATWKPLMDAEVTLQLEGNDLTCGCDIAWLVLEPSYHPLVADAQCHSGEMVVNLDPFFFENNC